MTVSTENLDESEVARFDALASNWWDLSGEFRPLHEINPTRLTFIRDQLLTNSGARTEASSDKQADRSQPLLGYSIVDVGCGGGLVTEPLAKMGASVTGIDPGIDNIEVARAHAQGEGLDIDYRATTVEALADTGATFDAVLCLEVLEHVPDPAAFLATCSHIVSPSGLVIASTISRTLKSYALAIIAAEYMLDIVPRGTHDWNRFIRRDELDSMFVAAQLSPQGCQGIVLDPLAKSWTLSRDTSVNYIASARKI